MKTALVLSAGGMFGAYQAGVWQGLAGSFRPDIVVGASVGALNGWCIASGCAPERLIGEWRDPNAGASLRIFDPGPLRAQASRLYNEYRPRMPLGVVVIEAPWMRTRLIACPDITPEHLVATCSIPVVLPPVAIAGRRYLDGGLLDKLPVAAAVAMGATRIVAVDALPPFGPLRLGGRILRSLRPSFRAADAELTVISPSEPLGELRNAIRWNRENVDRCIESGLRDAEAALQAGTIA